jgi:hypothetical protein
VLSNRPCECEDSVRCGRFFSRAEIKMNEMAPELSIQRYHEILNLFEATFHARERT